MRVKTVMATEMGEDIRILKAALEAAISKFENKFPDLKITNLQATRQISDSNRRHALLAVTFNIELNA